jgi:hypothetical protein
MALLLLLALAALQGLPPATSSFERAADKQGAEDLLPGRPSIWTKETVYRAQASH